MLLPLLLIPVLYLVMIRPQQKRQKQWQQMLSSIKAGDRVTTAGGIRGIIISIKDDAIIINNGRLVTAGPIASLVPASAGTVVTTPDPQLLEAALVTVAGARVTRTGLDRLIVSGVSTEVIGRTAINAGAIILGMHAENDDLEGIFENLIHPKEYVS